MKPAFPFTRAVFALALFACLASNSTPKSDNRAEAQDLLRQAQDLTDIRVPGSHSFHLTAALTVYDDEGQATEGTYDLLWERPTAWRDEIKLSDFSQTRIADVDRLFVSRKPSDLRFQVFQFFKLLEFPYSLTAGGQEQAESVRQKNAHGSPERAIEVTFSRKPLKTVYLDPTAPIPLRVEYKHSGYGFEFSDYVAFDGHKFPRTLVQFDAHKPLDRLQIQELREVALDPSFFVPPPDARWFHWCPHPENVRLVSGAGSGIQIPWVLRNGPVKRPVVIYGVIGTDGYWHNLEIVESAGKAADAYWMEIVGSERFSPAKCGDTPIEQESMVQARLP